MTEEILNIWEFDNYKDRKSSIELVSFDDNPDCDQKVRIIVDGKESLAFEAYRDQWGTYIAIVIDGKGITIAQEDGTRSFMDALSAALTKFRGITDIETTPPTIKEPSKS